MIARRVFEICRGLENLEIFESGGLTSTESVSVSGMVRVQRSDFHNSRKRYTKGIAHYGYDCWKFHLKYGEKFEVEGGIALLRHLSQGYGSGTNHSNDFLFVFVYAGNSVYFDGTRLFFVLTPRTTPFFSHESIHAAF